MPRVLLISTYDLGHPPFGLASAAAWLERAGFEVACNDLAVDPLDEARVRASDLVAFHLPMHTATRLASRVLPRVKTLRPGVPAIAFGLYAAMNAPYLRALGADAIVGGEFEIGLVQWARRLCGMAGAADDLPPVVSLERLEFLPPSREALPGLERYARLHVNGEERLAGYTEASRGCKHRCRHCPVVPVYDGRFRVVAREVVLEDVRRQIEAGARHVTFGDPDFWNGIGHAMPLVRELHGRFPELTYDVTIKVEHLLHHQAHLGELRDTGCAFVTTAAESVDDTVLERLDKGHTRDDFVRVVAACREAGLVLHPTFVAFHPWTTVAGYQDLLATIAELGLVEHVPPVQLALRLLIPAGSRLLELEEVRAIIGDFDSERLAHPWVHPIPEVDALQAEIERRVGEAVVRGDGRVAMFEGVWGLAGAWPGATARTLDPAALAPSLGPVPYLTEPWYC